MHFNAVCVVMHVFLCRNFTFDGVHVEGAQRLARIARESGVEKFIHVSHLNAQPYPLPKIVKGGSQYLKSKVHCFHIINVCCVSNDVCGADSYWLVDFRFQFDCSYWAYE